MEHDPSHARPFDSTAVDDGPRAGGEGVAYLELLLSRGHPDPTAVAHLIRAYSSNGWGHDMYSLLHQRMGNAFVNQVVAALVREEASPAPTPKAPADGHRHYALLAGGAEKDPDPQYPDPPDYRGMDEHSANMLQALPFFVDNGYDTRVLYGDAPKAVDAAQQPGLDEITKQAGKRHVPVGAFTPTTMKQQLAQIADAVQPGDEVMLMVMSHGFNSDSKEQLPHLDWNDPTSGHYMFLSGHSEMHLDELAPYRELIERKGGKLAVLLLTCTSEYGMTFASSSGETSVVSETGVDKGQGDFAVSFLSNLKPGMSLDHAFAVGKSMMKQGVDHPHISTETTGKPSGFTF